MDEFERIDALRARLGESATGAGVLVGIGDDAAVLSVASGRQVVSVDCAIEGTHFRWDFGPADVLMERAVTAALSDLAAMGACATGIISALALAPDVDDARFLSLAEGLARAARRYAVPVVGGNLSRSATTSITTTVLGEPVAEPVLRSGARPGDRVYVTGTLGGAGLGLAALLADTTKAPADETWVQHWLRPNARLDLSVRLAHQASAAIDISDGLAQDLSHICRASNVDAEVALEQLPLPPGLAEQAGAHGLDPAVLAATSGEAYELVFCAAPDQSIAWASEIGRVVTARGPGRCTLTRAGRPLDLTAGGFTHFP